MPQRCVLYYHLTWLTSPPIWWDSFGVVALPLMMNVVSHKFKPASMDSARIVHGWLVYGVLVHRL